jgi:hypothetical protein
VLKVTQVTIKRKTIMEKSLSVYRTLIIALLIVAAALTVMLVMQFNKAPVTREVTTEKPQTKKELLQDYHAYSESYLDLKEEAAVTKAESDGLEHRVVSRDGEDLVITSDLLPTRANFTVVDGKVTRVEFY